LTTIGACCALLVRKTSAGQFLIPMAPPSPSPGFSNHYCMLVITAAMSVLEGFKKDASTHASRLKPARRKETRPVPVFLGPSDPDNND